MRVSVRWLSYVWVIICIILPLALLLTISLTKTTWGVPPYTPLFQTLSSWSYGLNIHLQSYVFFLHYPLYQHAIFNAFFMALCTTAGCLILGYPMAYGMASARCRLVWVSLAMIPFSTPFILRIYAWVHLLSPEGVINNLLKVMGYQPCRLMGHKGAVVLGMVYGYLPFMLIPLYTAFEKISSSLIEASSDLGATRFQSFWRIVVPLSRTGAYSGSLMVFITSLGEYVIPELLGGHSTLTLGQVMWSEFFCQKDWPLACAMTISMIVCLWPLIWLFHKLQNPSVYDQGEL